MKSCPYCHEEVVELDAISDGNYEEFWGQPVWRDTSYTVCPHCHEEVTEDELETITEEEPNNEQLHTI